MRRCPWKEVGTGPGRDKRVPPSRVAASREGRNSLRPVSTISVGYHVKSLRGT